MNAFLEAALQYAGRGWRVFPCKPRGKIPLLKGGFKAATVAPAQIEAWWRKWPDANVAIATGQMSGLLVVDLDGEEAIAAWRRIVGEMVVEWLERTKGARREGALRARVGVRTGRGLHLYYQLPQGEHVPCSVGKDDEEGIDIRADGGFVLAPPSIHPSGSVYQWCEDTVTPEVRV